MQRFVLRLALLLAIPLAACGSADDPLASSSDAETPEPSPTTEMVPSPTAPATPTETTASPTTTNVSVALDGTRWRLTALDGDILDSGMTMTLAFSAEQATGNTGCNDYGGAYTATENGNFSMPEIDRTEQACTDPEGIMEIETRYFTALTEATEFAVIGDRLNLRDASGAVSLIFTTDLTSDSKAGLPGTSWSVVALDGEPLISDTHITMTFTTDQVSGSSGCNQFGGSYESPSDSALTFRDVRNTLMGCPEPAGVMEQEQAFLTALANVATYDVTDSTLRLQEDDGTVVVVLERETE